LLLLLLLVLLLLLPPPPPARLRRMKLGPGRLPLLTLAAWETCAARGRRGNTMWRAAGGLVQLLSSKAEAMGNGSNDSNISATESIKRFSSATWLGLCATKAMDMLNLTLHDSERARRTKDHGKGLRGRR